MSPRAGRLRRALAAAAVTAAAAGAAAVRADGDGDAARGRMLYESRCVACHSVDANRTGPAHRGVFGRRAGRVADYDYSSALRQSSIVWNAATLDRWLTNPEALIPGQRMGFSVPERADRADLIAYLRSVSRPATAAPTP